MNNNIHPCILFDGNAAEAADFYLTAFSESKKLGENQYLVQIEIFGKKIMLLNGPKTALTPALSMFINCSSEAEIDKLYANLKTEDLMPLQAYPFAEKYAWVRDRFGMTWQLMLNSKIKAPQKLHFAFLFANQHFGKAKEAIALYTDTFPNSIAHHQELYKAGDHAPAGYIKFAHLELDGEMMSAMDGPGNHEFDFNYGVSIMVTCPNQASIDRYWNSLTANGGAEGVCGWLTDPYGVSWQIVPQGLDKLMQKNQQAMMEVVQHSRKLNIAELEAAANS